MGAMTTATAPADRARGLLADAGARLRRAVPDGMLRAAAAGGEAAVLGWLAVVVPAVAAYVATATAPALGEATWWQAAAVGAGLWRLAHGGLVTLGGDVVSLLPLGLSLLAVGLVAWSARRAHLRTWAGLLATSVGYAAVAAPLANLPPTAVGGWSRTALVAFVVAMLGGLIALRRRLGALHPPAARPVAPFARVPVSVRAHARSLAAAIGTGTSTSLAALAAAGLGLLVASLVVHGAEVATVLGTLATDGMSRAMMVLAMLLYLPTVVVWAIAWLAGPGFAVGTGTIVAPGGVALGPLPGVPAFAALPEAGTAAAAAWWAPLVLLGAGALAGWRMHRRAPQERWWGSLASAVGAAAVAGLVVVALATFSAGGIGPGRMAELGPEPWAVGLASAPWLACGALLVVVPARPDVVALVLRAGSRGASTVASASRATARAGRERAVRARESARRG